MDKGDLPYLISNSKQISWTNQIITHYDGISDISINPLSREQIAATSFDSTISIYNVESRKEISVLKGHKNGVWTCDYHPTEKKLLSGGSDKKIFLWDTSSNKPIKSIEYQKSFIFDVKFSENGKFFGACSKDMITIWDTANLSKPYSVINPKKESNGFIYCLNFISDDKKVISGFIDGTIIIHTIGYSNKDVSVSIPSNYKNEEDENSIYSKTVFSLNKFHGDKNKILLTHSDGSVRIYKVTGDEKVLKLEDSFYYFTSAATCANTSQDDKKIIACGKDRTAQIWGASTHEKIDYTLSGHKGVISSAHFISEDLVVTSSYDNSVALWKL